MLALPLRPSRPSARRSLALRGFFLLLVPALAIAAAPACGGGGDTGSTGSSGSTGTSSSSGTSTGTGSGGGGGFAPVACDVHATSGLNHFTDRTDAWGLKDALVTGNRITAGDLDGDGYPDIIIHAIGSNARETIGMGKRLTFVMMNEPDGNGGRKFVDRTKESGYGTPPDSSMTEYRASSFALFGDIDNDGDLDILSGVYTAPYKDPANPTPADLDRSQVLLNDGKGHFTIKANSGVPPKAPMPTAGASFTDIDHDGKLDVFMGFWYQGTGTLSPQQLFQGAGDGTFKDISKTAGVTASANRRASYGVTTCDVDGDGNPELLLSAYGRGPNLLYQSDSPLHYVDKGAVSGYAEDADLNYKDNEFFKCYCTLHAMDADCQGVDKPLVVCPTPADSNWDPATDTKPGRLGGNTFSTACSDITGDGKLDLFNAEITHWWAGEGSDKSELLVNQSDDKGLKFDRPGGDKTGITIPHPTVDWNEGVIFVAAADMDLDGREDVILGATDYPDQYGLYFHQKADGTFEEVGEKQGMHHPCLSGLTVADFDRDGDLDLVVGSGTARDCGKIWMTNEVHFYENDASKNGGHFLIIKLKGDGTTTNAGGVGARVTIDAGGVKIVKELGGGYGHMAMLDDTVLFFGLGGCQTVNSIDVMWPNATHTVETFQHVDTNRVIEITQGSKDVKDISPKP
jgi:enediyne biosynthesis protein E4